jgi:hypothetical protein
MARQIHEYSVHFYGDWIARRERSHLRHIALILKAVS